MVDNSPEPISNGLVNTLHHKVDVNHEIDLDHELYVRLQRKDQIYDQRDPFVRSLVLKMSLTSPINDSREKQPTL